MIGPDGSDAETTYGTKATPRIVTPESPTVVSAAPARRPTRPPYNSRAARVENQARQRYFDDYLNSIGRSASAAEIIDLIDIGMENSSMFPAQEEVLRTILELLRQKTEAYSEFVKAVTSRIDGFEKALIKTIVNNFRDHISNGPEPDISESQIDLMADFLRKCLENPVENPLTIAQGINRNKRNPDQADINPNNAKRWNGLLVRKRYLNSGRHLIPSRGTRRLREILATNPQTLTMTDDALAHMINKETGDTAEGLALNGTNVSLIIAKYKNNHPEFQDPRGPASTRTRVVRQSPAELPLTPIEITAASATFENNFLNQINFLLKKQTITLDDINQLLRNGTENAHRFPPQQRALRTAIVALALLVIRQSTFREALINNGVVVSLKTAISNAIVEHLNEHRISADPEASMMAAVLRRRLEHPNERIESMVHYLNQVARISGQRYLFTKSDVSNLLTRLRDLTYLEPESQETKPYGESILEELTPSSAILRYMVSQEIVSMINALTGEEPGRGGLNTRSVERIKVL